jgi:hypothetical protein
MNDSTAGAARLAGLPGAPGGSGERRRRWILAIVCGALPAALIAAMAAVTAALWSRLPDQVADHWTLAGTATGTQSRLTFFLLAGLLAALGLGLTWFGWVAARRGTVLSTQAAEIGTGIMAVAIGVFLTAISAASVILVAVLNAGNTGLRSASVGGGGSFGPLVGSVLLAALAGYVVRRYGSLSATDDGSAPPSLGLQAGERAVWTGRARARWAWPTGVLSLAAGAIIWSVTARWPLPIGLLALGLLTLGFTSVQVTVAARGNGGLRGARAAAHPLPAAANRVGHGRSASAVRLGVPGQPARLRCRGGRAAPGAGAAADAQGREDVPGHGGRRGDRGSAAQRPDRPATRSLSASGP